jgi:hypothetical protein
MKRCNLRTIRYLLVAYCLFDWFIGGNAGGFLPLTPVAAAQFTNVSGTVTDPNGLPYASGTITAALVSSGTPSFIGGLGYTPPTQPTGLNAKGVFVVRLADTTQLSPAGSKWIFTVCSAIGTVQPAGGPGSVCFSTGPLTISGAAQDISAQLQAAALPLSSVSNSTFPTPTTATESVNTVTLTTVSGNFPAPYLTGNTLSMLACSVAGYNISAVITGGGAGTNTLTFTDPTSGLGAATGCIANIVSGSSTPSFSTVLGGTNPNALLVSGSLAPTGGGTITANLPSGTLIAQTGVDINTSFQITALHLAAPLGTASGGTGINTSASSGIAQVAAGVWSVSTTLPAVTLTTPNIGVATGTSLQLTNPLTPINGGTGLNSSLSTGIAQVSGGTWSISNTLPNGITTTTQPLGDNSPKLATDLFVLQNTGQIPLSQGQIVTGNPAVPGGQIAQNKSIVAIEDYYNAASANTGACSLPCQTADFGLALQNIWTKFGLPGNASGGVHVELGGLSTANGGGAAQMQVFTQVDPYGNLSNNSSVQFSGGCNVLVVTSVAWRTPSSPIDILGCQGTGASNNTTGLRHAPCAITAGCGPNHYPMYNVCIPGNPGVLPQCVPTAITSWTLTGNTFTGSGGANPFFVGETAAVTGLVHGAYLNGLAVTVTATVPASSFTVTGTFTAANDSFTESGTITPYSPNSVATGGFNLNPVTTLSGDGTNCTIAANPNRCAILHITGTAAVRKTVDCGSTSGAGGCPGWSAGLIGSWITGYTTIGANANACVGYITGYTPSGGANGTGQFQLYQVLNSANGCTVTADSAVGPYLISEPNANYLMWLGGNNYGINCFAHRIDKFITDLEGMPYGMGLFTNNCQEATYLGDGFRGDLDAGDQTNHGFGCTAAACSAISPIVYDSSYGDKGLAPTHFAIDGPTLTVSNNTSGACTNSYGFVFEGWSLLKGAAGNADWMRFDTIAGKSSTVCFNAAVYDDGGGQGSSVINVGHVESSTVGIDVGELHPANVTVENINMVNCVGAPCSAVKFGTNQGGSGSVVLSASINSGQNIINDVPNGYTMVATANQTQLAQPYWQPGPSGASGMVHASNTMAVTSADFSVSNTNTLTAITGLSKTLPAFATTYSGECDFIWESTGVTLTAIQFGVGLSASSASTTLSAGATGSTSVSPAIVGYTSTTNITGPQLVVTSGTPGGSSSPQSTHLWFTIENVPTAAPTTLTFYAAPATASTTTILIKRGAGNCHFTP